LEERFSVLLHSHKIDRSLFPEPSIVQFFEAVRYRGKCSRLVARTFGISHRRLCRILLHSSDISKERSTCSSKQPNSISWVICSVQATHVICCILSQNTVKGGINQVNRRMVLYRDPSHGALAPNPR